MSKSKVHHELCYYCGSLMIAAQGILLLATGSNMEYPDDKG